MNQTIKILTFMFNFIVNFVELLINRVKLKPKDFDYEIKKEDVLKIKSRTKKMSDKLKYKAKYVYKYEDDELFQDTKFDKRHFEKSLAVIHYTGNDDIPGRSTTGLEDVTQYLTQSSGANVTWAVGRKGVVHRHLPSPYNPSWTQGLLATDPGGFINHLGKWTRRPNDIACAFEVVNTSTKKFTEAQYEAVALRVLWMLEFFPNFRLQYCCSHQSVSPFTRSDPGVHWDWEMFFIKYCGMKKKFYNEYLTYLTLLSQHSAIGNREAAKRQVFHVKEATNKMVRDLLDKPKDFCF